MSEKSWYARYPSDFIAGTIGLTCEEKGAYAICLDLIYDRGGPIPDDARWIAGACGCSVRKWKSLRSRLIDAGKLTAVDDGLTNVRAEKEIEKRAKIARKHAENGSKGGRKKPEKQPDDSKNNDIDQAGLKHRGRVLQPQPHSEDKSSGVPPDCKSQLFGPVKDWLVSEHGISARNAGGFLGKCLKLTGDDAGSLLDLFRQAHEARPADVQSWVMARLKPSNRRNGNRRYGIADAFADLLDEPEPHSGDDYQVAGLLPHRGYQ